MSGEFLIRDVLEITFWDKIKPYGQKRRLANNKRRVLFFTNNSEIRMVGTEWLGIIRIACVKKGSCTPCSRDNMHGPGTRKH